MVKANLDELTAHGCGNPSCQLCDRCNSNEEDSVWFVLRESQARKIVAAVEKGHAYEVVAILKQQPWWPEICAAVRGLPYKLP